MAMTPTAPTTQGVYEMALEVDGLEASERFYVDMIGLSVVARWDEPRPAVWLGIGGGGFLGLWSVAAGGEQSIHHGRGGSHVHFALRVPHGTLNGFAQRLEAAGHAIEWRHFDEGNVALYADDPDGNVLELTELVERWDGRPDRAPE